MQPPNVNSQGFLQAKNESIGDVEAQEEFTARARSLQSGASLIALKRSEGLSRLRFNTFHAAAGLATLRYHTDRGARVCSPGIPDPFGLSPYQWSDAGGGPMLDWKPARK